MVPYPCIFGEHKVDSVYFFKKKEVMTLGGVEPGGVGGTMGSEYD